MDILKYLPNFLSKDPMFHCAAETCNEEHDRLRLALQDLADNFFVNTATSSISVSKSSFGASPALILAVSSNCMSRLLVGEHFGWSSRKLNTSGAIFPMYTSDAASSLFMSLK